MLLCCCVSFAFSLSWFLLRLSWLFFFLAGKQATQAHYGRLLGFEAQQLVKAATASCSAIILLLRLTHTAPVRRSLPYGMGAARPTDTVQSPSVVGTTSIHANWWKAYRSHINSWAAPFTWPLPRFGRSIVPPSGGRRPHSQKPIKSGVRIHASAWGVDGLGFAHTVLRRPPASAAASSLSVASGRR